MNITDILILLVVLLFVLIGFRDGFFKKIFGILGFLGGLICATKFMAPMADYGSGWLGLGSETSLILAFFSIFLLVIIVVNLFYRWFGESGAETLKYWSRLLGGFLGAAQGAVAVSLVLLMFDQFGMPSEETKHDSLFYGNSVIIAPKVFDYMTKWLPASKKFEEELKEIKSKLERYKN